MKKLLGILVLGLLWCNVGFAQNFKNNFYKYAEKYRNAETACEKKGGTFTKNHMLFLNAQKCLYEEDIRLILSYMSDVPNDHPGKDQMFELSHERHLDLYEAARTLSRAAVDCNSNECILPHVRAYVDFTHSIQERYFNKQQKLINKIYK